MAVRRGREPLQGLLIARMVRDAIFRLIGGIALAVVGWRTEVELQGHPPALDISLLASMALSGLVLGLLLTPDLTVRPLLRLKAYVRGLSDEELLAALLGLMAALVLAALATVPLAMLPGGVGRILPVALAVLFAYFGVSIGLDRRRRVLSMLARRVATPEEGKGAPAEPLTSMALLDTSAIIDGRIVQIGRAGFVPGALIIPQFVLDELQQLADSSDPRRRTSARHGLDMLRQLKAESVAPVEIMAFPDEPQIDVDQLLIVVAQRLHCPIISNDFNLSRVAEIKGVPVLNVNVLADSLRPVVAPGDHLRLRMVEMGGQPGQARGYLEDGTMVVVERGQHMIGQDADIVVQRIRQQDTGRIIFAVPQVDERSAV